MAVLVHHRLLDRCLCPWEDRCGPSFGPGPGRSGEQRTGCGLVRDFPRQAARDRLNDRPRTHTWEGSKPSHPDIDVAITREHVLQALSTVPVDAKGTGLVASGRLSDVVVDDAGRVMFSITIDPSEAADMERVRQAAVTAVQGLPSVTGVFASLTADQRRDPGGALPRPRQRSGPGSGSAEEPAHPRR